ncbi:MAG: radical SAM protein, partial [Nanoarchaeota archaeon]
MQEGGVLEMKVAGIYWYDAALDPKIQHAVSEPYGLEKILAVAQQEGHEVDLFLPLEQTNGELAAISKEEVIERVMDFNPDIACFSLYTCQYPAGKRIAAELKKIKPKMITVAGNRYPSYLGAKNKRAESPFDFFIVNEGEETFLNLLKKDYFNEKSVLASPSLGMRIKDLDSYPLAFRHPLVLEQIYLGISLPPLSAQPHYALMEYSRGCPGVCKFCDNQQVWNGKLTFRSPERVVEEMFQLQKRGVDIFYFIDLNFTASHHKAEQLCNEMLNRGLKAHWYAMSNIETLDGKRDLLALMKEAGCYKIAWGIESTSNASLRKMDKKISGKILRAEQAQRVLENSLQAGMLNQGYYIIGFPWENAGSIIRDAEGLKHLPLHQLNVGIFTPIPLSGFYSEEMELNSDLEKHDRNHLVYKHLSLTNKSVKIIQNQMHRDFYSSPEYLTRVKESCRIEPRFKQAFN